MRVTREQAIQRAKDALSDSDIGVLREHLLLIVKGRAEGQSYKEIGEPLGLSGSRVAQLESRAYAILDAKKVSPRPVYDENGKVDWGALSLSLTVRAYNSLCHFSTFDEVTIVALRAQRFVGPKTVKETIDVLEQIGQYEHAKRLRMEREEWHSGITKRKRTIEERVGIPTEVRSVGEPLAVASSELYVGFCKGYENGPHVLLTVQREGKFCAELALQVSDIELLIKKLRRTKKNLDGKENNDGQ